MNFDLSIEEVWREFSALASIDRGEDELKGSQSRTIRGCSSSAAARHKTNSIDRSQFSEISPALQWIGGGTANLFSCKVAAGSVNSAGEIMQLVSGCDCDRQGGGACARIQLRARTAVRCPALDVSA